MATGAKKGLNPSRKRGSGPDNKGLSSYSIANAYATDLGLGDLVKRAADGSIQQGVNGDVDNIGTYLGVLYTTADGDIVERPRWAASTVSTDALAKVMDDPLSTYNVIADGDIGQVDIGDVLPVRFNSTVDATTGRSNMEVRVLPQATATAIDFTGETDIGANTPISDTDAFTVDTATVGSATTITIADGDGIVELLADLNAVTGISAEISEDGSTSGFLTIKASDGSQLRLDDTVGTPLVDMGIIASGATNALRINPPSQKGAPIVSASAEDFRGEADIGANLTMTDLDAFDVTMYNRHGEYVEAGEIHSIVIADGDGASEFLSKLNDVPGLRAWLDSATGFLQLEATNNGDIEIADVTGTPAVDMGLFVGRTRQDASAVKVVGITDTTNNVLEVSIL